MSLCTRHHESLAHTGKTYCTSDAVKNDKMYQVKVKDQLDSVEAAAGILGYGAAVSPQ